MSKLIGRFFFKLTDSKNLIGEFSHNTSKRNRTESADRITPNACDGKFDGEYFTTWYDDEGGRLEAVLAKLAINKKPESENIYSLTWNLVQAKGAFYGEGMLCDGILIGDYRAVEKV